MFWPGDVCSVVQSEWWIGLGFCPGFGEFDGGISPREVAADRYLHRASGRVRAVRSTRHDDIRID